MAKIFSSDLHRNDNASIQFGAAIAGAVRDVRQGVAQLARSRKADEYAPGAIHVLRKLCDGERTRGHIHRNEVEEWQSCFFAWLKRVKRWFPDELAADFEANAEDDFRVILECSDNMPEYLWRGEVEERGIRITFKNDVGLKTARKAANEKRPVKLGSALHKYIDSCIATLVHEPSEAKTPTIAQVESSPSFDQIQPRFVLHDDGKYSIFLQDFACFDSDEEISQDIVTTAYDVEDAIQRYINANHPESASDLHYDCESSMFCARSAHLKPIAIVAEVLIRLAADRELYLQHRGVK